MSDEDNQSKDEGSEQFTRRETGPALARVSVERALAIEAALEWKTTSRPSRLARSRR